MTPLPDRLAAIGDAVRQRLATETRAERAWRHALRRVWERGGPVEARHDWQQRPAFLAWRAAMGGKL